MLVEFLWDKHAIQGGLNDCELIFTAIRREDAPNNTEAAKEFKITTKNSKVKRKNLC